MAVPHDVEIERELWDAYAESARQAVGEAEPGFRWTQYEGHGPGPELLGEPSAVLELGCGTGRAVAYLAERDVQATGVDLSPVMVRNTTERWGPLGAEFVCAEAIAYLERTSETYDAVYSVFGAAWFADPDALFPLVAQRLASGGVFAFSQPPAIPGAYGPQGMYKGGFTGRAMYSYRYSYEPDVWRAKLLDSGFEAATVEVLDAPHEGHIGTLLCRARVH